MSETTVESEPRPSGGGANVFTRKLGALPLWAWMGIGLAVALGYYYWRGNSTKATAAQTAAQASQAQAAGQSAGGVDSNLVPQFVNQTYVQNTPPAPTVPTTPHPAPATQASQYPAPKTVTAKKLTSTSGQVNFDYVTSVTPTPTSYTVAVYTTAGKLAQYLTVNPDTKTSQGQVTVNGLRPGSYNVRVWANGGKIAPPGTNAKLTLLCQGALANRSR